MLRPELIAGVRRSEPQAIEVVFLKTHDKAYSVAYHVLKDEYEAEDVVQDAYITMMEKADTLKDAARFESWFYQIVKNAALDQLRKHRADPFSSFENDTQSDFRFEDTLVSDYTPFDPEASADYAELQRIMQGFVQALPEMQRKCMELRFHWDMKIGDIAQKLGIPESTVKSNLTYGKKKIEAEVRALEKQGVKLYSLTPLTAIAFLRWMWGNSIPGSIAAKAASGTAAAAAAAATGGTASAAVAGSAAAGSSGGVAAAAKAGISLAAKKLIAGVCAAVVVTSAAVGAVLLNAETRLKDILRVEKQSMYEDFVEVGCCVPQFTPDTEGYRQVNKQIMQSYEQWEYLRRFFAETPQRQDFFRCFLLRDANGGRLDRRYSLEEVYAMADPYSDGFPVESFDFTVAVYKLGPFLSYQIISSMFVFLDEQELDLRSGSFETDPEEILAALPPEYRKVEPLWNFIKIEDGTPADWEDVAAACQLTLPELSARFLADVTGQIEQNGIPEPDRGRLLQDYAGYFNSCAYASEPPHLVRGEQMRFFFPVDSSASAYRMVVNCTLPDKKMKKWETAVFDCDGVQYTSGTNGA